MVALYVLYVIDDMFIMKNIIVAAIKRLSKGKRIFCSEADFQFSLAWEIMQICKGALVYLEDGIQVNGQTYYVDIIVVIKAKKYYIELKYQTSECSYTNALGSVIQLKEEAAEDLMRYNYLNDINRLLTIKQSLSGDFGGGYAIILSNDTRMYKRPSQNRTRALDHDFRIHERGKNGDQAFPIPGIVKWNNTNPKHWTNMNSKYNKQFYLPPINTKWEHFLTVNYNNKEQEFKYLINSV